MNRLIYKNIFECVQVNYSKMKIQITLNQNSSLILHGIYQVDLTGR